MPPIEQVLQTLTNMRRQGDSIQAALNYVMRIYANEPIPAVIQNALDNYGGWTPPPLDVITLPGGTPGAPPQPPPPGAPSGGTTGGGTSVGGGGTSTGGGNIADILTGDAAMTAYSGTTTVSLLIVGLQLKLIWDTEQEIQQLYSDLVDGLRRQAGQRHQEEKLLREQKSLLEEINKLLREIIEEYERQNRVLQDAIDKIREKQKEQTKRVETMEEKIKAIKKQYGIK